MIEQTLNGRPIIIRPVGNTGEYMVYYEDEIIFTATKPVTDQERRRIQQELIDANGAILGDILGSLLSNN